MWGFPKPCWQNLATYNPIRVPVDQAYTLKPQCYKDAEFFDLEKKLIFKKSWVCVGLSGNLTNPGDTITAEVGGQPIFVTRDKKGNLNAFHNVCRHRGSKLVLNDGRYPVISCPYHRWGYSLSGKLLATPMWNTVEGGEQVNLKTGDRKKKQKRGDRLRAMREKLAADAAAVEEAEKEALSPNSAPSKSLQRAFDTNHMKNFDKKN